MPLPRPDKIKKGSFSQIPGEYSGLNWSSRSILEIKLSESREVEMNGLCHRLNSGQGGYSEDHILKNGARTGPKSLYMSVT